jgi:DNA repair photolyase
MSAPIIPGLTDHEIPAILQAAAAAGATFCCYTILRLPYGVADLFEQWLTQHFPDRKDKILGRIRDLRGGELNDSRFRTRMKGEGVLAKSIADLFALARQKAGLARKAPVVSAAAFRRPVAVQAGLFDDCDSLS